MGILLKLAGLGLFFFAASQVLTFGGDPEVLRPPQPDDGLYLIIFLFGGVLIWIGDSVGKDE